jgi:hypothetical protein
MAVSDGLLKRHFGHLLGDVSIIRVEILNPDLHNMKRGEGEF